jgi:pimeloyl-ACP methyl ester carboxylesterase
VAERLAGEWRVMCPDLRGRGDSAYAKDSDSYNPLQYVDDVTMLLFESWGSSASSPSALRWAG